MHLRQRLFPLRFFGALVLAVAGLGAAPALQAAAATPALPEFIELGDAELQTPAGAALVAAQETFRESLGSDPARALESAKAIVALTREAFGAEHDNVARALTNLAIVQAEDADFTAAIDNYIAAIGIRERASGSIVAGDLINPLRGLASAYMALDAIDRAIPVFERAIHISHVNLGPENLDQVEIIDALGRAYYFSGDYDNAGDMQDAILRLRERRSDDNPDQYLDALEQRAEWHVRLGEFERAVRSYRKLRRAISEQYGKNDVRLIEPLVALADAVLGQVMEQGRNRGRGLSISTSARSPAASRIGGFNEFRTTGDLIAEARRCQTRACAEAVMARAGMNGQAISEGRGAINRAVRIARAHEAESPARLARTLVKQGDWLASLEQPRDAWRRYREAWNLLSEDPELHETRDQLLGAPVPLARVAFRTAYGSRSDAPADPARYPDRGHADIAFDVDTRGRPRNVRIVSADPAGLMDRQLAREMRRARFRPVFSDGKPRTAKGFVYRHPFRYDAAGLKDRERNRIAKTTYDNAPGEAPLRAIDLDRRDDDWLAEDAPGIEARAVPDPAT